MVKNLIEMLRLNNSDNNLTFEETTLEDIEELLPVMFLPEEENLLKEQGDSKLNFILESLKNALVYFTLKYKKKTILLFGINKKIYNDKYVIWIYPNTKSKYKIKLAKICKKFVNIINKLLNGVISFEPKRVTQGLKWVKLVGGKVIGETNFNNLDFYIIGFGG